MRVPLIQKYEPDAQLRWRIATYLALVIGGRKSVITKHLPRFMPSWGGMRIRHGGDAIRTTAATRQRDWSKPGRNNSYVRVCRRSLIIFSTMTHTLMSQYEIIFEHDNVINTTTINYGSVEKFLVCSMGDERMWGPLRNSTQLLAVITPCKTDEQDASKTIVRYKTTRAPIVTDIRNIMHLIGRVHSQGSWGIIDRSMNLVEGAFLATDEDVLWNLNMDQTSESSSGE